MKQWLIWAGNSTTPAQTHDQALVESTRVVLRRKAWGRCANVRLEKGSSYYLFLGIALSYSKHTPHHFTSHSTPTHMCHRQVFVAGGSSTCPCLDYRASGHFLATPKAAWLVFTSCLAAKTHSLFFFYAALASMPLSVLQTRFTRNFSLQLFQRSKLQFCSPSWRPRQPPPSALTPTHPPLRTHHPHAHTTHSTHPPTTQGSKHARHPRLRFPPPLAWQPSPSTTLACPPCRRRWSPPQR